MWSSSSGESVFLRPLFWFSTCSAIVVLLNPTCVQCVPSEIAKRSSKSASDPEVVDYLKKFGYLNEPSDESANSLILDEGAALETAIKSFQEFANLPVSGKIDERTAELLKSPRCGLPDHKSSSNSQRTKRSLPKSDITWSILQGNLPAHPALINRQLRKAFNVWQRNARISFRENDVGQRNTDISISFERLDHGDHYPFDGKGKTLAHAYALQSSNEGIEGDVHFDNDEEWTVDERSSKGISLFSVAVHELGHSLGLKHEKNENSVMFPIYQQLGSNFELSSHDRYLIQEIFGPPDRYQDPVYRSSDYPAQRPQPTPPKNPSATYPEYPGRRPDFTNPGASYPRNPPEYPKTPYIPNNPGYPNRPFNPEVNQPRPYYPPNPAPPSHPDNPTQRTSSIRPVTRAEVTPPAPTPRTRKELEAGEPDACNTTYDAISVIRRELFIFKGKYYWRFRNPDNRRSHHEPSLITRMWNSLPRDLTHVDAVYQRASDENKMVFFIGKQMYQFDGSDLDPGYPKSITSLGLDPSVDHIDAAMVWGHNKRTYLFSGHSYWKLTEDETSIEGDYPKDMSTWDGIGYNIDAAFQYTDGATYFFKGKGYWRFNDRKMRVRQERSNYSAPFWMGCESSPRGQVLSDGDLDPSNLPVRDTVPVSHQPHKYPSTPSPPTSFQISYLVIAGVAVLVVLLIVAAIVVIVRRRRRKHSYQQPKWLIVNKKIIM